MKCGKLIILFFLFSFLQQAIAQSPLDTIVSRSHRLAANRPAEMIYLQISKGIYETGEDLWFKAYVLDAQFHSLSTRSQTLYVQMFGENDDKVVWQEKYPIENGIVAGHVYVPIDLSEGNYFLEAYTRHSFYEDSAEISAVRKVKIQSIVGGVELPAKANDSIKAGI